MEVFLNENMAVSKLMLMEVSKLMHMEIFLMETYRSIIN